MKHRCLWFNYALADDRLARFFFFLIKNYICNTYCIQQVERIDTNLLSDIDVHVNKYGTQNN